MLRQLPVCFFMVVDVHEERLTWWPLQQVEVSLEVRGKLNSGVIGKVPVEDLYDLRKGICLLEILQCPVQSWKSLQVRPVKLPTMFKTLSFPRLVMDILR